MELSIGERIKERRKALKITGAKIREQVGISTGNLSDIEHGKCLPSAKALIQLAKTLDCSIDYILLGETLNSEKHAAPELTEPEELLLRQFRTLSEDEQEEILFIVQFKYDRALHSKK